MDPIPGFALLLPTRPLADEVGALAGLQPLYPGAKPCVGSGFCCKRAPCCYGERDPSTGWCVHLQPWPNDDLGVPRYRCGRFAFIVQQPGSGFSPAFGAGCSSTLFNPERERIISAQRLKR